MTKNPTHPHLHLLLVCALVGVAGACVEPRCPDGTFESEGRCIDEVDAAVAVCLVSCSGDTPVCDPASGTCVGCLSDASCDADTPACSVATRTCVGCTSDAHCGGDTPSCDVAAQACVGCLGDADCPEATAAACSDATSTCTGCVTSADCARFGATPECDVDSGTCVACTKATEAARCGNFSCNVITNTCTTTPRGSLTYCSTCTANSECPDNARCARRPVLGGATEYVCLYDATEVVCGAATRPFADFSNNATDVDGSPASVCFSSLNVCSAVTAYTQGRACSNSGTCSGGSCVNDVCSILCGNDDGCRVGDVCSSASCVDN